jgi:hypothetical protein
VAWIQKGVTTQEEIVARLGSPNFPGDPSLSPMFTKGSVTPSEESRENGKEIARGTMRVPSSAGPRTLAQYVYCENTFSGVTSTNFWVCYSGQGIVQNFGFAQYGISTC